MMNWLKKLTMLRLLILVIYDTKIGEIKKKILDHNHDKYITTQEFNNLRPGNFAARLAQAKLSTKGDIADLAKRYILMIN